MDRHGLQGVGVIMLASILMFVAFQHSETLQRWTFSSSSSASSSSPLTVTNAQAASKLGVSNGLRQRTAAASGSGRQLLQVVTPAPAPAPGSSQSQGYISYGALTAGYVPCPPQSGRPYYTTNCQSATGPVQPYTRGCSAISLCARS